ncbi:hypothetical protein [Streptomyces lincolnensis]|nr:hypothetical protein [Streptomyces lincolnensis]
MTIRLTGRGYGVTVNAVWVPWPTFQLHRVYCWLVVSAGSSDWRT